MRETDVAKDVGSPPRHSAVEKPDVDSYALARVESSASSTADLLEFVAANIGANVYEVIAREALGLPRMDVARRNEFLFLHKRRLGGAPSDASTDRKKSD